MLGSNGPADRYGPCSVEGTGEKPGAQRVGTFAPVPGYRPGEPVATGEGRYPGEVPR